MLSSVISIAFFDSLSENYYQLVLNINDQIINNKYLDAKIWLSFALHVTAGGTLIKRLDYFILKELLAKIEEADSQKKLAVGIQNVWREAVSRKGNLLIVEKNYIYAAEHGGAAEVIYPVGDPLNKYALIKDAVDEVIEKVIEYGGDIEFVDDGVLDNFEHIALILYF